MVVGMADCQISRPPDQVLVTYALGSCIAVAMHDPVARVGGMLHFMLPESSISTGQGRRESVHVRRYGHPAAVPPRLRMRAPRNAGWWCGPPAALRSWTTTECSISASGIIWPCARSCGRPGVLVQGEEVGGNPVADGAAGSRQRPVLARGPGTAERELAPAQSAERRKRMAYRVLIVDDSPAMRAFIRRIIELSGLEDAEFLEAADGREALNLLREQWVDVC